MSAVQNLRTMFAYAGLIAVAMAAGSAAPVQAAADVSAQ